MQFRSALLRTLPLAILLIACEAIIVQDPQENFVDGKAPASALRIANQIWDLPAIQKILARVIADQKNPHLIRVGIMDNGTDLAHPDLVGQIDFKIENGRIVGAGADIMGGDAFASPQILRYEYYAYGAKAIVNGKIDTPPADPFQLIRKHNDEFISRVFKKLSEHPVLKSSEFAKILTPENFSIVAAESFVDSFKMEDYQSIAQSERGFLARNKTAPKSYPLDQREEFYSEQYLTFQEPWRMDTSGELTGRLENSMYGNFILGSPSSYTLARIEHADLLAQLLETELNSFGVESGYFQARDQLKQFLNGRLFDRGETEESKVKKVREKIGSAIQYSKRDWKQYHPLIKYLNELTAFALAKKIGKADAPITHRVTITPQDLKAEFIRSRDEVLWTLDESIKLGKDAFEPAEWKSLQEARKKAFSAWKFIENKLDSVQFNADALVADFNRPDPQRSAWRQYLIQSKHPLIDPESIHQNHGTHTAGTVSVMNPDIRIFPIRVNTQSTKASPQLRARLIQEFTAGFQNWLAQPIVKRAIGARFAAIFPDLNADQIAEKVRSTLLAQVEVDYDSNPLDYLFVDDVRQAVKVAGQEKLKLVNVSLGTNFNKAVIDYTTLSPESQVETFFDFFKFEYFKWKVAEDAQALARQTLFLVATGNDGAWLDGKSKSGLPVDLSSPFLARFETQTEKAPNNHIKNILGVGSLSQLDDLSSFTNILLSRTPMILARGEAVMAPIRTLSNEALGPIIARNQLNANMQNSMASSIIIGDRLDSHLIQKYGIKGTPDQIKEQLDEVKYELKFRLDELSAATQAFDELLFVDYPIYRAPMSGTSMATPTVAGLMADWIQKEMVAKNISAEQLYTHPDFAPEALIQVALNQAEPLFEGASVIQLKKWIGETRWAKLKTQDDLEATIKELDICNKTMGGKISGP